jgi:hypothetical protein
MIICGRNQMKLNPKMFQNGNWMLKDVGKGLICDHLALIKVKVKEITPQPYQE